MTEPAHAPVDTANGPTDPIPDRVEEVRAVALTVPADAPESDGTLEWASTTMVVVSVTAAGRCGLGYTYTDAAAVPIVHNVLAPSVVGRPVGERGAAWMAMSEALRNVGRPGLGACALSAVDVALWDLHAKVLGIPVGDLVGRVRDAVPAYGSGGFTSYSDERLAEQLGSWVDEGFRQVKMKVGRDASRDVRRVAVARAAIGPQTRLFVDGNGGYHLKEALVLAEAFAAGAAVTWFEEPVSSEDLDGLRLLRERAPAGMEVAAGEYGYDVAYFARMIGAGAVDVLQVDATRAGGYTGFLAAAAVAEAAGVEVSAHCAPSLHAPLGVAVRNLRHVEWFHDHVRVERLMLAGTPEPRGGGLYPDRSAPGLGLEVRGREVDRFVVAGAR